MPGLMDSLRNWVEARQRQDRRGIYEHSGPIYASENGVPTASRRARLGETAPQPDIDTDIPEKKSGFQERLENLQDRVDQRLDKTWAGDFNRWSAKRGFDFRRHFGKGTY